MTGHFCKVYEETYKDQLIEIYCFSQFAPGGVGSSHFYVISMSLSMITNCPKILTTALIILFVQSRIQAIRELQSNRRHSQPPKLVAIARWKRYINFLEVCYGWRAEGATSADI
jgi:hypothetical protein